MVPETTKLILESWIAKPHRHTWSTKATEHTVAAVLPVWMDVSADYIYGRTTSNPEGEGMLPDLLS